MKTVSVPCQVERSLFSCQFRASFKLQGDVITTLCDASVLNKGSISLIVVEEYEDGSTIATVPGELIAGWRIVKVGEIPAERSEGQQDDEKEPLIEKKRLPTEVKRERGWGPKEIFDSIRRLKRYA